VYLRTYTESCGLCLGSDQGGHQLNKHGVDFADAVVALEDELALSMPDPFAGSETRFIALGRDAFGRTLVVVYSYDHDDVRLISAREAEPRERRQYEEQP
jgi:uncharacterized DUF497 family protein